MEGYHVVNEDAPITQFQRDYIYRMLVDAKDDQSELIFEYIGFLESKLQEDS